jgi:transposase
MLIIGCDFHSRFQQIAMLDSTTGEVLERRLEHENGEAQTFYATLPSPARIGMEATCDAPWFERVLREHHHELWIGDAAEIRAAMVRKQRTDSRDALHILDRLSIAESPSLPGLIATPPFHSRLTSDGVASTCRMHPAYRTCACGK